MDEIIYLHKIYNINIKNTITITNRYVITEVLKLYEMNIHENNHTIDSHGVQKASTKA